MRVLYLHQHFSTPDGAAGTRSYEMSQALIRQGHTVTMVCGSAAKGRTGLTQPFRRGQRRGTVDGIDVIEIELPYSNDDGLMRRAWLFAAFALRAVGTAVRQDADIVFATTTPLTTAIPGIAARTFRRKRRFVFEVRDLWPELPKAMGVVTNPIVLGALGLLETAAYRRADELIGLSPGICQGIRAKAHEDTPITLVPNGCDLHLFRQRPSVSSGTFRAVFTGSHGKANGLGAVLDAAALLLDRNDAVEIHFIGTGSEKPTLVKRAASEGLTNCVFHEPMPKTQLAEELASFDAGLMILDDVPAFYYGTSPNKFFDYLSIGLPVVTNYPGWVADLITEHDCGIAVPPREAAALADALNQLASERATAVSAGLNARQLAESEFSRDQLAAAWIDAVVTS